MASRLKKAETIWETLEAKMCWNFGYPKTILYDNEASFMAWEFCRELREQGILIWSCGAYAKHQNGMAGRLNGYLGEQLKTIKAANKAGNWLNWLPEVTTKYSFNYVKPIKSAPYELVFGRSLRLGREFAKVDMISQETWL